MTSITCAAKNCLGYFESLLADHLRTAAQKIIVNEPIGDEHDFFIHSILAAEMDHGLGMSFSELLEETLTEACLQCCFAPHQWRKLVMVAHQDKGLRQSQGTDAGRQGQLRGFVDDAVIKTLPHENWMINAQTGADDDLCLGVVSLHLGNCFEFLIANQCRGINQLVHLKRKVQFEQQIS